jgi:type II secretory pathway component GspD/PulD (secretin)
MIHRKLWSVVLVMALASGVPAQQTPPPTQPAQGANTGTNSAATAQEPATSQESENKKPISGKDKRRAARLFIEGTKQYQNSQFEAALQSYEQAATFDQDNSNYRGAAEVARGHAVTALIQTAAKTRMTGDTAAERTALQHAAEIDPSNPEVAEHLRQIADDEAGSTSRGLYEDAADSLGSAPILMSAAETHSFHLRSDRRQLIQNVFRAYGIEASVDQSVSGAPVMLDLDDVSFAQATHAVNMVTNTFTVPIDAHRALVARDSRENRNQFTRLELETVYLGGLTPTEMTDIGNLAKSVFQAQQVAVEPTSGTLTVRAPTATLNALNATLRQLLDGRSQVLLEVRLIQVAHTHGRNIGVTLPQQITAFNVYAEEQAILRANQALVQQIIASGLAAPGDTLAILAILIATGQVQNSFLQSGFALFGGGLTLSGLTWGPTTVHLNLNSSDSRELDQLQMRLGDGEEGTLKAGSRYPIMTSSFTNLGVNGTNIPGITSPGSSSGLAGLLASVGATSTAIPQIQYQDLGLTLKATPRVIRSGDVALTIDLKITALGAGSLNGVPVLNNRSYSGVVTLKEGSGVVVVSQVDKEESHAISGTPGVSEIPGMNNLVSSKDVQQNYATLLIVITPHVVRGTQAPGHSAMMRVDRGQTP